MLLMFGLFGCARNSHPGPSAEEGRRRADPVREALAAYHEQRGAYPRNLRELAPQYLPREVMDRWDRQSGQYRIEYEQFGSGRSYLLRFFFEHEGGETECSYRPEEENWVCLELG